MTDDEFDKYKLLGNYIPHEGVHACVSINKLESDHDYFHLTVYTFWTCSQEASKLPQEIELMWKMLDKDGGNHLKKTLGATVWWRRHFGRPAGRKEGDHYIFVPTTTVTSFKG